MGWPHARPSTWPRSLTSESIAHRDRLSCPAGVATGPTTPARSGSIYPTTRCVSTRSKRRSMARSEPLPSGPCIGRPLGRGRGSRARGGRWVGEFRYDMLGTHRAPGPTSSPAAHRCRGRSSGSSRRATGPRRRQDDDHRTSHSRQRSRRRSGDEVIEVDGQVFVRRADLFNVGTGFTVFEDGPLPFFAGLRYRLDGSGWTSSPLASRRTWSAGTSRPSSVRKPRRSVSPVPLSTSSVSRCRGGIRKSLPNWA